MAPTALAVSCGPKTWTDGKKTEHPEILASTACRGLQTLLRHQRFPQIRAAPQTHPHALRCEVEPKKVQHCTFYVRTGTWFATRMFPLAVVSRGDDRRFAESGQAVRGSGVLYPTRAPKVVKQVRAAAQWGGRGQRRVLRAGAPPGAPALLRSKKDIWNF
ncbi:hypothetical protein GWK47_005396 [Chionoecetes opilio]|uniref:Uncharacterized protein n=1 Tax=Chionoecetes opilio TaxID=41210 RepID=A0A8J5CZ83_CHIOP|nr:hypothetical protein GWK47_005396 [Chionoecetes opilio]